MRIWFKEHPKSRDNRSSLFDGDVLCIVRLEGRKEDIVFQMQCPDVGTRETIIDLLNTGMMAAIKDGSLHNSPASDWMPGDPPKHEDHSVGRASDTAGEPDDDPQGTESEYDAAREAATLAEDEEQDEEQEGDDSQEGQEEEVVAAGEPEESSE